MSCLTFEVLFGADKIEEALEYFLILKSKETGRTERSKLTGKTRCTERTGMAEIAGKTGRTERTGRTK